MSNTPADDKNWRAIANGLAVIDKLGLTEDEKNFVMQHHPKAYEPVIALFKATNGGNSEGRKLRPIAITAALAFALTAIDSLEVMRKGESGDSDRHA